ncbi:serine carboxypeptidase-like 10 [Punica granatum]|nr:serine carboxypeptidase-like 10 [Punica granatum]
MRMTRSTATITLSTIISLMLLCVSDVVPSSHSIIKTLPGFPGDLPFQLETGYIGVGELEQVQLFYYFIESERSPKDDALFLWLTGGPGCSAFSGLIYEIGPLLFDYSKSRGKRAVLKLNPYSWTKVANIIFVDSPVGTGFSYAKSWTGFENSDTSQTALLYEFLRKWFLSHPQFQDNPLYITGDSYSGKIIPMLVEEIYNGNKVGLDPEMNLRGYVIGNPVTYEAKDISMRVPYAHLVALISDELYQSARINCKGDYMDVDPSNAACLAALQNISICTDKIYPGHILEPTCALLSPQPNSSRTSMWNRRLVGDDNIDIVLSPLRSLSKQWCRSYNYLYSYIWANDKTVQRALHVREGTKEEWQRCNKSLSYTKNVLSTVPYHYNLTKTSLRVLIYSGDHDFAIPYIGTMEWIKSLNLTVFGSWAPWFVEGQIAGYSTLFENTNYDLTFTTIKGGGHTAPEYKPKECLAMIDRWLAYYPL